MEREELIKKWLDHNLNPEEQIAFEALEDYDELVKLSGAIKDFASPDYSSETEYKSLSDKLPSKRQSNWLQPLLKVAAALLLGASVVYYTYTLDTTTTTEIAQQKSIELPDASAVNINAFSKVTYNKSSWKDNRRVSLNGEAYFKVAKGSKFDVITRTGKVSVLGTEFNVKHRDLVFEVTCYEGSVEVNYNNITKILKPGERFSLIDGTIKSETENRTSPSWLNSESSFTSKPLFVILNELERQYNIKVDAKGIDDTQIFSGSFTHNDLELALQSITLPLDLVYTNVEGVIVLTRE